MPSNFVHTLAVVGCAILAWISIGTIKDLFGLATWWKKKQLEKVKSAIRRAFTNNHDFPMTFEQILSACKIFTPEQIQQGIDSLLDDEWLHPNGLKYAPNKAATGRFQGRI